jgi:hypothetical protein
MIRFHLPASAVERLAFAYSPLFEAVLSLHVLIEPKHHPLQHEWVQQMRGLPSYVRRDLRVFAFCYRSYVPEVLAPAPVSTYAEFEEEIDRLLQQPPTMLALEFSIPFAPAELARDPLRLADPKLRENLLGQAIAQGRETARSVRLLLDDPTAFTARFADVLWSYWRRGVRRGMDARRSAACGGRRRRWT